VRRKLALAATVGTLALAPGSPDGEEAAAPAPIVQVFLSPGSGRRLVFPGQAADRWLRTWTPPSFYLGDRPVVRRLAR
jgi:hypothetical protein